MALTLKFLSSLDFSIEPKHHFKDTLGKGEINDTAKNMLAKEKLAYDRIEEAVVNLNQTLDIKAFNSIRGSQLAIIESCYTFLQDCFKESKFIANLLPILQSRKLVVQEYLILSLESIEIKDPKSKDQVLTRIKEIKKELNMMEIPKIE